MITIEEAKRWVQDKTFELEDTWISTDQSVGYVLSQTLLAPMNMPSFRNSAMDGYALMRSDLDNGLRKFSVVGEIQAGSVKETSIESGQAYRIFTGALLPVNADVVVMQENTNRGEKEVEINTYDATAGANIREIGEQTKSGDILLEKGHVLNPASVGLLASFGISGLSVVRKPSVGILTTGNELKQVGQELRAGEIYESNSFSLRAALHQCGITAIEELAVLDNEENTIKDIGRLLENCDLLISSGGISVGKYDFVKSALEKNEVEEVFYKINQKPGKPMYFGVRSEKLIFALPGNPASLLVCFYEYVLPALNKLMGRSFEPYTLRKELDEEIDFKGSRPEFLRGRIAENRVEILEGQRSFMLKSFAEANCLVYIHGEKRKLPKGSEVEVHPIYRS
jgi:molybdopterin molybdotransferase